MSELTEKAHIREGLDLWIGTRLIRLFQQMRYKEIH